MIVDNTHFNDEIKIDISFILVLFYLSSHGLMVRIPDFQPENLGSNPAGGIKVFHFFFLNFQNLNAFLLKNKF